MTGERWMKFYPSDWLGDAGLRTCSEGARGAWIDILCLMDGANPRGHLKLGRKNIDLPTLAGLLKVPPKRLEKYLDELRAAGVFSVTNRGMIYSRKMVREEKWRKMGAKAAARRWSQDPEKKGETEKRITPPMTPESRIQNRKSLPSGLVAARGGEAKAKPARDPPDYSQDPIEATPALLRSPLIRKFTH